MYIRLQCDRAALDKMESSCLIYSIQLGSELNVVKAKQIGSTEELEVDYASLTSIVMSGHTYLLGYDPSSDHLDVFQFLESSPWVRKLLAKPGIGSTYDIVEPFIIGNKNHLMCYRAKNGVFDFFGLNPELSITNAYQFYRNHEPGLTQGFTTIKPFTYFKKVAFLGYNAINGYVALYDVAVTATSPADITPLLVTPCWSHQWAQGWTRFAFFQLGGENFFLKTNTWKPNISIDHILDDLSGAVEVSTGLDLLDAQELYSVQPFYFGNCGPYFATYKKSGETTLNRIHSDCYGWTKVASFSSKENASHILPISNEGRLLLLIR